MNTPKYITRKEIAQLIEASVQTVTRNERQLGLDRHKIKIRSMMARFRRDGVLAELRGRGFAV